MFLAIKFITLFLNLAKIQIFIPKSAHGGSTGLGIIPKKKQFFSASLSDNPSFKDPNQRIRSKYYLIYGHSAIR